jgi:hypothetical protein
MSLAERQGVLLKEAIETAVYAAHGSYTNFTNASIGGSAGNITVSENNIDNIIRGIKREIREAAGEGLLERNGGFIVWRPADFEYLEAFMQANGFNTADAALKDAGSANRGVFHMGLWHYSSNLLSSGHVIAGVKKAIHLGILKSTFGQVIIDQEPSGPDGTYNAVGVVSRVDYAVKAWANMVPVIFDVTVA